MNSPDRTADDRRNARHAGRATGAGAIVGKVVSAGARPWIALALPPLAWFVFEIGLASALRWSCRAVGAGLGVGWGVASLLVCALAVGVALPIARPADDQSPSRIWVARVAQCLAGVFALAIAFQTIGTLIVPPCAR